MGGGGDLGALCFETRALTGHSVPVLFQGRRGRRGEGEGGPMETEGSMAAPKGGKKGNLPCRVSLWMAARIDGAVEPGVRKACA
jgi:hypothetical protein